MNRVERRETQKAYQAAKGLVTRYPRNAQAHFALAYVLRYAGKLKESGDECEAALALDPGNFQYRSCALWVGLRKLNRIASDLESRAAAAVDPEPVYREAAVLSFCDKKEAALSLLRTAISHDYCALGSLQSDPLLSKLRETPEFGQLLSAAKECQRKYLIEPN